MDNLKETFDEAMGQWEKSYKTPFVDYNVKVDKSLAGGPLRDRLHELLDLQGTISGKVAWYKLLYRKMSLMKKFTKRKAFKEICANEKYANEGPKRKGEIAESFKVKLPDIDKKVSFYDISLKELVYEYFSDVGVAKLNELKNNLEVGRSLLSWDKEEISKRKGIA